ncbi:MAG: NotI family restriction endonuclease [Thermodesulfobacteriota bacterium]
MAKYPSELFGYYLKDTSKEAKSAREGYQCPFHGSRCYKQSRLVDYPFGVCTAHFDGNEIALCPRRFLENGLIFKDIAKTHFGSIHNILVFSEVGLPGIGNFDFVMVKHKPLSNTVEDFVAIELQTGQTTSTGKLVQGFKDLMESGSLAPNATYNFGINSYDIWKRTFTQILNKGIILEKWKRKIFWVVQEPIFEYFRHKYRLGAIQYGPNHSSVFLLYDLKQMGNHLVLSQTQKYSSSIDALFEAFRKNDEIPPVEKFVERLQAKVDSDLKLGLRLDKKISPNYFDAPKPTSSGRVKEEQDDYGSEDI